MKLFLYSNLNIDLKRFEYWGKKTMKVGRNKPCLCGSGKKSKYCCFKDKPIIQYENIDSMLFSYFIVFDQDKERKELTTVHLFDPILADVNEALWYCLHLPRHGTDLFSVPEKLYKEGDILQQHDIRIISSKVEFSNFENYIKPTLFICEDSIFDKANKLSELCNATLGCIKISEINSSILAEHWSMLRTQTQQILEMYKKNNEAMMLLDFPIRLLDEQERKCLPNIFIENQFGDIRKMFANLRKKDDYSAFHRMYQTKYQKAYITICNQLGHQLNNITEKELRRVLAIAWEHTPCTMVITLPGGVSKRKSYGIDVQKQDFDKIETNLVDFFGIQRAISQQGVWIGGEPLDKEIFNKLDNLERHYYSFRRKRKFIIDTMKDFGEILNQKLGINLGEYALAASRIIAFTDFPIGLAIPPGYSDPLCSMTSISYRPLTPLTHTYKYGLHERPDHYIGTGIGFKVLIVECLAENDRIRKFSDIGWTILRKFLSKNKRIEVYYEVANSVQDLEAKIEAYSNIDFLIISAHGTYNDEMVAGIDVAGEYWLPKPTLKVPPVVILSACHVASKGRGNYTINDAFLNAGALAVLGTLIPVDVLENADLTRRFFLYLSETIDGHHDCLDIADVWKRVVNMNIFYSVITQTTRLKEWAISSKKDGKILDERFYQKLNAKPLELGNIHIQCINIIKELAEEDGMERYLELSLEKNGYLAESLFYIFSGFPEKVLLKQKL